MDLEVAKRKLNELIEEIEKEGSFLSEHSCDFILDDLKEIKKLLK